MRDRQQFQEESADILRALTTRAFLSSASKVLWDVLARALSFASSLVIARSLGTAGFGRYAVLWYLAWMTAQLTDLGLHLAVLRNLSGGKGSLRTGLRLKAASSLLTLGAGAIGLAVSGNQEYRAVLPLWGAALAGSWCELFGVCLRSRGKLAHEGAVLLTLRAGWLAAAGWALLVREAGIFQLGMWLFAGSVPGLVLGGFLIARESWPAVARRGEARMLMAQVAPLAITALITLVYLRVDVLLLAHFRGDEEAGLFTASFRLVEALFLFSGGIVAGAFPLIAARAASGSKELGRLSGFVSGLLLSVALPATAGLAVLAGPIVSFLYGTGFASAAPSLRVLSLSLVAIYINALTTHLMVATGRGRALAAVMAARLAVGVGIDLFLIPSFGSVGAALAVVGAEWSLTVLSLAMTRPWLVPGDLLRAGAVPMACSVLMAALVLACPVELPVRIVLGAAVYGTALLFLGKSRSARELRGVGSGVGVHG